MAAKGNASPEYRTYWGIRDRCFNPKAVSYPRYGGRGITMCDEWVRSFGAFFAHIGPKPSPLHSIDRIDNARGYEPGNVRWATRDEQKLNQRCVTVFITHDERRLSLRSVATELAMYPQEFKRLMRRSGCLEATA